MTDPVTTTIDLPGVTLTYDVRGSSRIATSRCC